jgi:hypothetical protein
VSESAAVDEGGTVYSLGRRTGARDGGAGGAGRARVRRGIRRRVGLAGVCRTRISVVLPVYASDVCQFRDTTVPYPTAQILRLLGPVYALLNQPYPVPGKSNLQQASLGKCFARQNRRLVPLSIGSKTLASNYRHSGRIIDCSYHVQ